MAIDWQTAPDWAVFYANGRFRDYGGRWMNNKGEFTNGLYREELSNLEDFCERPVEKQWPENDERINNIGLNRTAEDMGHYNRNADEALNSELSMYAKPTEPKAAVEFLNACAAVQSERGKQYDASGTGERSFAAAASAFNAATGKSLTGSDVCLLLTMVKLVRQYSSPNRLHHDSLLDGVSYLSLWAEELTKELGK
jgi:hypothetical protein